MFTGFYQFYHAFIHLFIGLSIYRSTMIHPPERLRCAMTYATRQSRWQVREGVEGQRWRTNRWGVLGQIQELSGMDLGNIHKTPKVKNHSTIFSIFFSKDTVCCVCCGCCWLLFSFFACFCCHFSKGKRWSSTEAPGPAPYRWWNDPTQPLMKGSSSLTTRGGFGKPKGDLELAKELMSNKVVLDVKCVPNDIKRK